MQNVQIDLPQIATVIIGLIVWFSRLESKTLRNEKDIAKIIEKHDSLESKLIDDLNQVKLALTRIEVRMEQKEE
jgi:hypothetical protein